MHRLAGPVWHAREEQNLHPPQPSIPQTIYTPSPHLTPSPPLSPGLPKNPDSPKYSPQQDPATPQPGPSLLYEKLLQTPSIPEMEKRDLS